LLSLAYFANEWFFSENKSKIFFIHKQYFLCVATWLVYWNDYATCINRCSSLHDLQKLASFAILKTSQLLLSVQYYIIATGFSILASSIRLRNISITFLFKCISYNQLIFQLSLGCYLLGPKSIRRPSALEIILFTLSSLRQN
jgi:hypothetical protein